VTPLVSVVMAVRNGQNYVREAVDSVLRQSLQDHELIVVDDGSTDDTGRILASYSDERLRVLTQSPLGLAASLNRGIGKARADLIARMDADDVSEPHRLERQVTFMLDRPDHVVVGSDVHVVAEDGACLYRAELVSDDTSIRHCLDRLASPFYHGAVMLRRQAVMDCGLYDERVPSQVEDMLLWLRIRGLGQMANIPEPLYRYRLRPTSLSRLPRSLRAAKARLLESYAVTGELRDEDIRTLTVHKRRRRPRASRASYELDVGKIYLDQVGDPRRARSHLARAVGLGPLSPRAWFNLCLSFAPGAVRASRTRRRNRRIQLRSAVSR
jgi:glycosyltransferase involved in cell wall biosynthesis